MPSYLVDLAVICEIVGVILGMYQGYEESVYEHQRWLIWAGAVVGLLYGLGLLLVLMTVLAIGGMLVG